MSRSGSAIVLVASHSHLFRGASLTAPASQLPSPLGPAAVVVAFSDGVDVEAELLAGTGPGDLALAVPAHQTATGHPIAAAVWPLAETRADVDADQVRIKLGQRLG